LGRFDPGGYGATLAAGAIPSTGGTFTLTGTGGADFGPFTAAVTFTNPIRIAGRRKSKSR